MMSSHQLSPRQPLDTVLGPIDLRVSVPGSKSISNRALICAALADGWSEISNLAPGDDTQAMLACLTGLGVDIEHSSGSTRIHGVAGAPRGGGVLDARLAGTTSRFVTSMAALSDVPSTITGGKPLLSRPMGDLHTGLIDLGAHVEPLGPVGFLPVKVSRNDLRGGNIGMRGDVSSQFLSSLMLIAPYLPDGLTVNLTSKLVSRPYVDMTAHVMGSFGVRGVAVEQERIVVPRGRYEACTYRIEPDASSASYPLAAVAVAGGRIEIEGLSRRSLQGDIRFLDVLEEMGCTVRPHDEYCEVASDGILRGVDIDMADISDLVPTVAVLGLFASTPTRIRNVGFIRAKESDRIGDLVAGIEQLGGHASETEDGLIVLPAGDLPSVPVLLSSHHDHRLAMAWSLVALRRNGVSIDDPSVVSKSWPEWWQVRELIQHSSVN
jgi:3-phosphoshikimate 1-carboxyvinyltransferase